MLHQTLKDRHALPSTPCGVIPRILAMHKSVAKRGPGRVWGPRGCGGLVRPGGETGAGLCACWHSRVVPRALLETARAAETAALLWGHEKTEPRVIRPERRRVDSRHRTSQAGLERPAAARPQTRCISANRRGLSSICMNTSCVHTASKVAAAKGMAKASPCRHVTRSCSPPRAV